MNPTPSTVEATVPLSELLTLARLGYAMRSAQRAYFKKLDRKRGVFAEAELRAAKDAEQRFDRALSAALAHEQQTLPGMGGEEGGAAV